MTTLEISLIITLYSILGVITYQKQYKAGFKENNDVTGYVSFSSFMLALFAPLTIVWYAIRAVFFEDWL